MGIDLGIQNYIHTSDGETVDWLDLEDEYERLQREQRRLSRKEQGSNNYEKQRREVAKLNRHIKQEALDFQHDLTTWLVLECVEGTVNHRIVARELEPVATTYAGSTP